VPGSDLPIPIRLPRPEPTPFSRIGRRFAIALGLVVFVAVLAYLGRDGYVDADGTDVSLLDAFYYSTVSITTTGYGDVRPVSDGARLVTTLLVTPARIVFLILLVGTTLEFLLERTREGYLLRRWRARLRDHIVVCGFGTKGKSAVESLHAHGVPADRVVVIDVDERALAEARAAGHATIEGNAARTEVLRAAGIESATAVIVAPDRDDSAVLMTLTARELNRGARISASVREAENMHLLRESGADTVILSSGAAGRLLGMATQNHRVVDVLEDLLIVGEGLDLIERDVLPEELGDGSGRRGREVVLAVVRGERVLRFDDPEAQRLEPGDRVICLCNRGDGDAGG
jgi:voltage-gated potassium channel